MNASGRPLSPPTASRAVLFSLVALALLSASAGLAAEGAVGADPSSTGNVSAAGNEFGDYLLHVGDRVRLWVWGEPSLTTEVAVMPDGTVSLPLVGTLHLVGKSIPVATKEVEDACRRYLKDPRVSLSCIPQVPLQVYVEGSVSSPGPVPYDPRFRLLDYLGRAGGPTTGADLSTVVVTSVSGARVGTTKFDLSAPLGAKEAPADGVPADGVLAAASAEAANPVLSPGDTIWVGKAVPVAVIGAVRNPGAFDYRSGQRMSEYVSLAGGPTARADLGGALLRHTKDGVTTSQKVDVAAALTSPSVADSDPVLAPGDVLTIPEEFLAEGVTWSDVLRAVTAALIWW
jgi:polysaccharide export outer membrane protein